jgi:hypothetical protein
MYVLFYLLGIEVVITNVARHSTDREVALMMLMAYLSYTMAEVRFFNMLI